MEGDLSAGVQLLNLIAHVLEEQAILLQVHFQASLQQAQQEPHTACRYQTLRHTNWGCQSAGGLNTSDTSLFHGNFVFYSFVNIFVVLEEKGGSTECRLLQYNLPHYSDFQAIIFSSNLTPVTGS